MVSPTKTILIGFNFITLSLPNGFELVKKIGTLRVGFDPKQTIKACSISKKIKLSFICSTKTMNAIYLIKQLRYFFRQFVVN